MAQASCTAPGVSIMTQTGIVRCTPARSTSSRSACRKRSTSATALTLGSVRNAIFAPGVADQDVEFAAPRRLAEVVDARADAAECVVRARDQAGHRLGMGAFFADRRAVLAVARHIEYRAHRALQLERFAQVAFAARVVDTRRQLRRRAVLRRRAQRKDAAGASWLRSGAAGAWVSRCAVHVALSARSDATPARSSSSSLSVASIRSRENASISSPCTSVCSPRRRGDRKAVHDVARNAVAAVGCDAHRHPLAVAATEPVMHVIDRGIGGRRRGGEAARLDDGGAALAHRRDEDVAVPVLVVDHGLERSAARRWRSGSRDTSSANGCPRR